MSVPRSPKLFTRATEAPRRSGKVCVVFLSCSLAEGGHSAFGTVIPFKMALDHGASGLKARRSRVRLPLETRGVYMWSLDVLSNFLMHFWDR